MLTWVLLTSRTFTDSRFENIVPENIGKTKKTFFLTVISTDTHSRAPPTLLCLRYAQTPPMGARGHRTRADLPRLYTHLCGGALDAGHRCVRCMPRSHVTAAA